MIKHQSNREQTLHICSDYYLELITAEKIELEPGLYLLGSKLGWILSGRFGKRTCNESSASMLIFCCPNQTTLEPILLSENSLVLSDQNIDDFWRLENVGIKDPLIDSDNNKALQHSSTLKDNRYHVTWPWRDDVTNELPENFELAMGRLRSLLKRMKQTSEYLTKYNETIQDQLEKGIIEKVDTNLQNSEKKNPRKHYVPHHGVITPSKFTTKVRIVYDGSAKTKKDTKSPNECLLRGSVILEDLSGVDVKFS